MSGAKNLVKIRKEKMVLKCKIFFTYGSGISGVGNGLEKVDLRSQNVAWKRGFIPVPPSSMSTPPLIGIQIDLGKLQMSHREACAGNSVLGLRYASVVFVLAMHSREWWWLVKHSICTGMSDIVLVYTEACYLKAMYFHMKLLKCKLGVVFFGFVSKFGLLSDLFWST